MLRPHRRSAPLGVAWLVPVVSIVVAVLAAPGSLNAQSQLTCGLNGYTRRPDATAVLSSNVLALEWAGAEGERVSLRLAIRSGTPMVEELSLLPSGSREWVTVGRDLG